MILRDLYFGAVDAKNELVTSTAEEFDRFLAGFLVPPTIRISDLLDGDKYFITGMKGVGKTSLLRYLDIAVQRDHTAHTQFFLFKSDFSEEERVTFSRAAGKAQLVDSALYASEGLSFESLWKWFIYKSLVALVESSEPSPFIKDGHWSRFRTCVLAPQLDDESSGITRLLPRLSSGMVSIPASPSVEIDFDWDDKEKRTVQFSRLTRQADELFQRLESGPGRAFLFFDELEINTTNNDRKRRDTELIRDLIIAVERFNGRCRAKSFKAGVIAAVRSEILFSIESIGKEINKAIADFGVPVIWTRGGVTDLDHPLLDIIIRRLQYSERVHGNQYVDEKKVIWDRYFPKELLGKSTPHYLLDMTWHRPRDFVRLLNIAKTQFPNSRIFNDNSLTASKKEYSHQSWVEITEELSARYERAEIEALRTILSGSPRYFYLLDFQQRIASLSEKHAGVSALGAKYGADQIVVDLYNVGILGNQADIISKGKAAYRYRYYFRGDFLPILQNVFVVHTALCPFFGIN